MQKDDPAHKETDIILAGMEKELDSIYSQAYREARETANEFMVFFRELDIKKRLQLKNGDINKSEFKRWRRTMFFREKRYYQMADTLAADMTNVNKIAASIINKHLPEVYAINHNYGTYEVEHGSKINTQYTLYDRFTVERLLRDNPDLLPRKAAINVPEDIKWNKKKINSAVTQGILQGEDIDKISKRVADTVTDMNHTSAVRNARTMTTSAESGGRVDSYKRAEGMGISMQQVWLATLDNRTRHEHRQLDGQKRAVGEPFEVEGNKIEFPGDPKAEPFLVYNCRCTLIAQVKGVNLDLSDVTQRDSKLGAMSYEQWKEEKRKEEPKQTETPKQAEKPKEITTIEEAHSYLGSIFASVEKNLSYLDEELVTVSTNQLKKLNDKFKAITEDNHGYISGSKIKAIAETSQHLHDENTNLTLSSKYYVDKSKILELEKKMQDIFYSMPVADEYYLVATITHEYGHILENDIIRRRISPDIMEEALKLREQGEIKRANTKLRGEESKHARAIFNEILDIAREEDENFKLKESLSKYGHTNTFEAFAETFMNSQCGAPNVLGKAMNKWLKKEGY